MTDRSLCSIKVLDQFSRFDTIPVCDGHTGRQTDRQTDGQHRLTANPALG